MVFISKGECHSNGGEKGPSSWAMAHPETGGEKPQPVKDVNAERRVREKLNTVEGLR